MSILALLVLGFAIIRMFIALVNLLSKNWLKPTNQTFEDLVSVLIPARNEEESLPALLTSLQQQKHKYFEVIVYDDESTDRTAAITQSFSQKDERFKYLKGKTLPEGWMGKNHACHQLAQNAKGTYFLFLDADVQTGPELIQQALAYLNKYKLSLLSIFPVQKMASFGERITVPVMNWILVSLLPMILIRNSRMVSFAAANGQFMLFRAADYKKYRFHELLKDNKVEDIEISRKMKSMGLKVHTLLANQQVSCRMYDGFRSSIYGFSKNVVNYFGNSYLATIVFGLVTTFGWLVFLVNGRIDLLLIYLAIIVLTRLFVSLASRQNPFSNILFLPLQQLSFDLMVIQSLKNKLTGKYQWKGRSF
jgi:glycosyltransferase involved in cell wall biosynthesis